MDKFCEERTSWPRPRIKLIIDVEKDYYEMIKYDVEHGQDYKTFEIIANGVPYNPTGDSISREGLKEVINDLFRSGEYDCNSVLKAIDNAPTVTPSLNLNNITEEDIEKFKTIFQRAHSKGLLTILEEGEIVTKSQPKPLSDLINREALKRAISEATYNFEQIPIRVDKVQEIIDNAPAIDISGNEYFPYRTAYFNGVADGRATTRPQDEWIPVDERLPEERINPNTNDFEDVLCSTIWDDVRTYKYGKPIGYHKAHFWHSGGIMDAAVIAWQYKPEPYKKGGAK